MAHYLQYMKCKAGCPQSTEHKLFRFPRNESRFKQWAEIAGIVFSNGDKIKAFYLCGRHFHRNQFRNDGCDTLIYGATPTIVGRNTESLVVTPSCAEEMPQMESPAIGIHSSTPAKPSCVAKLVYSSGEVPCEDVGMDSQATEEVSLPSVESALEDTATSVRPMNLSSSKKKATLLKQLNYTRVKDMTPKKRLLMSVCQKRERSLKTLREKYKNAKMTLEHLNSVTSEPSKFVENFGQYMTQASAQFLASQMRCMKRKPKGRRWTMEDKLLALSFYKRSPKCYALMRSVFLLPHKKTLIKMVNSVPFLPGIDRRVFSALAKSACKLGELDRTCVLMMDEMSIREHLQYDPKSDRIVGFEDLGSLGRTNEVANHALVFMLRGLKHPWKQPVAFFFTRGGMCSEKMVILLRDVLTACTECGLNVVATVSDMGSNNVRTFKIMGASPSAPFFFHEGKKIFTFFDPPHLLKCLRNMLLKHNVGLSFSIGGEEKKGCAKWRYIQEAYDIDQRQPLYHNLEKLTMQHLNPTGYLTMRVSIAAETLSHIVASTISCLVTNRALPDDALYTAQFVGYADRMFDSVNGKSVDPSGAKGLKCQLRVEREDLHLLFWKSAVREVDTWKFDKRKSAATVTEKELMDSQHVFRPPCQDGWMTTLAAFPLLWEELKNAGFLYLEPRAINQDALEHLFGSVRQQCGSNDNPTLPQFISALKSCIINGLAFRELQGTNCEVEGSPVQLLNDLREFLSQGEVSDQNGEAPPNCPPDSDIIYKEFDILTDNFSVPVVSGFIAKKLFLATTCTLCRESVTTTVPDAFLHNDIICEGESEKDCVLVYPTKSLIEVVGRAATLLENILPHMGSCDRVHFVLTNSIKENDSSWLTEKCIVHAAELQHMIAEYVCRVSLPWWCRRKNNETAAERQARAMQRKVKILRHH